MGRASKKPRWKRKVGRTSRAVVATLLAASILVGVVAMEGGSQALADDGDPEGEPQPTQLGPDTPLPPKPRYRRLDSQLNRMVERVEQSGSEGIADSAPLYEGDSVAVAVRLSHGVATTTAFLEQNGARVANVIENYIEAYVPVALLAALADREGVLWVEAIVPPQPDVTSQGAALHRSPVWNARGFTGAGVRVGVIDVGFVGFGALMGAELPATVVARCYTAVGIFTSALADCETDDVHGTAVAEAVADVASDVELYIANPSSFADLQSAASWMVSQGVQVINHSVGWIWAGPGDGTSPFSDSPVNTVDLAVSGGVMWVNAAGNSAQDNWFGGYSDADSDGFLEFDPVFAPGVEVNSVTLKAGDKLIAQARWEDTWGGAARDFDLGLFNSNLNLVDSSINAQSGAAGQNPYERIVFTAPQGGTYHLVIDHFAGGIPAWLQLNVFTGQNLSIPVAATSMGNPAESANPGMLAVGAADWETPTAIELFSSQGPTTDGRTKPDVVGADRGDSASYGPGAFSGTSQASPHVAGLAALVHHQFPAFTPQQVADYLKAHALPRGAVPNNTWGHGLVQLPSLSPGPPTNVAATAGDAEATVSWSAPADGGSSITQYTATSSPGGLSATVDGSTLSATVTGLANDAIYTFVVTATNGVGTSDPSAATNAVTPTNLPPVVQASSDQTANEGDALSLQLATFTDPSAADTHTAAIDWGDGASTVGTVTESGGAGSVSGAPVYADNGNYTVTIAVTDSVGGVGTDSLTVAVSNVAPTVDAGPDQSGLGTTQTSLPTATFTDPGSADTHTATIDWGDGAITSASINSTEKRVAGQHTYTKADTYTVTITVTDGDGGAGSDSLQLEVAAAVVAVRIPGVTGWGLAALGGAFGLLAVLVRRRMSARRRPDPRR